MLKEAPSKYFFLGIIAIIAIISIIVIFPFLTSIITGLLLAYLFYPFYNWMRKLVKYKGPAAFITAVLIILIVTIPAVLLVKNLTTETSYLYLRTKQHIATGEVIETKCYENNFLCKSINSVNNLMRDENIKQYAIDRLNEILTFITKKVSGILLSLPTIVIHLLLILFTTYYALKDGKELLIRATQVAPLKVHHQEQIFQQFSDVTYAVLYGSFVVALIQGALGAFGFWLFGIKGFLLWGAVMTLFALIPFVGTWLIWFPASLVMGISGYLGGETGLMWKGIGLFFYGLLVISSIDNILKPVIVAGRAKVHPMLILIGILGGLYAFGFIGLVLGPLILAILQTLLQIYERERKPHANETQPCILGRKNHQHKK
ncbi:MAG: AI-2E family transporter [Candidatus Woesearchaeota archaeon]|nr:AI-2E family transporter [Candidatus Woesearchaeota archaeon]